MFAEKIQFISLHVKMYIDKRVIYMSINSLEVAECQPSVKGFCGQLMISFERDLNTIGFVCGLNQIVDGFSGLEALGVMP